MPYSVQIERSAKKEIRRIAKPMRERIVEAIGTLAEKPDQGTLLKGDFDGLRRLRQGSYRIIYEVQPSERRALVVRVAHRKDAYRRRR